MRYGKEKTKSVKGRIVSGCMVLLCAVMLALIPAASVLAREGTVTASSANIRSSADPSATVIAGVIRNNKIDIISQVTGTDGKAWYKINVDADTIGYIRADLVSDSGAGSSTTTTTGTTTTGSTGSTGTTAPQIDENATVSTEGVTEVQPVSATVTKDNVRVRADSTTNSSIVNIVNKDVALTVNGTKAGTSNDTWYLVNFMVDSRNITGYIRSDYVNLSGELLPPEEPEAPVEEPVEEPDEPEVVQKDYETQEIDGQWYLISYAEEPAKSYPINGLITVSEQNALALKEAQSKLSGQTTTIVILVILLVVMALAVTLLVFKMKDMSEGGEGFHLPFGNKNDDRARSTGGQYRQGSRPMPNSRPSGNRPAGSRPVQGRPAGVRPAQPVSTGTRPVQGGARPAGARPAQPASTGTRPVQGGTRPAGARPAQPVSTGTRPVQGGTRPAGARPVQSAGTAPRPAQSARPTGARPAQPGSNGNRPVQQGARPTGPRPAQPVAERQARPAQQSEQTWKSKNFLAEDDDFEFEFLNWDGEEDNR